MAQREAKPESETLDHRPSEKTTSAYRDRNSTSDRTLNILTMFTDERPLLRAGDVVEQLGVARSTAYRYLQTLTSTGFLEDTPGGYRLGLRIFELARIARQAYGPEEIMRPALERLARETGGTALLTRRSGVRVYCVERAEPPQQHLRLSYERGRPLTFNAGAAGQVLLAWEPPEVSADLLARADLPAYTAHTLTTIPEMTGRLAAIREDGIAISEDEVDLDTVNIAAPVWQGGRVTAGIGIVVVGAQIAPEAIQRYVSRVRQAAEIVSERMDSIG